MDYPGYTRKATTQERSYKQCGENSAFAASIYISTTFIELEKG